MIRLGALADADGAATRDGLDALATRPAAEGRNGVNKRLPTPIKDAAVVNLNCKGDGDFSLGRNCHEPAAFIAANCEL